MQPASINYLHLFVQLANDMGRFQWVSKLHLIELAACKKEQYMSFNSQPIMLLIIFLISWNGSPESQWIVKFNYKNMTIYVVSWNEISILSVQWHALCIWFVCINNSTFRGLLCKWFQKSIQSRGIFRYRFNFMMQLSMIKASNMKINFLTY